MLYGLPPVSHRERAVFLLISLTMRSPLTNTDETRDICSESVELTQGFTKSFQVWEMVGGKWVFWLGLWVPDGGGKVLHKDLICTPAGGDFLLLVRVVTGCAPCRVAIPTE